MSVGAATVATLVVATIAFASLAAADVSRGAILSRAGAHDARQTGVVRSAKPPARLSLALGAALAGLVGFRVGGPVGAVAALAAIVVAPTIVRRRRRVKATTLAQDQLAEGIAVLAAGLRAGRSLRQAFELAAAEVDAPIGPTFHRVSDRVGLGDPMDEAVEAWAAEISGADARLAAGVLRLHRRTGGALAGTLDELASTLRARRSTARELRSLTAQARLSANILGLLPIGFFAFLSLIARDDVRTALTTPAGATAIGLGLALQATAYVWIRRLLRIEP